MRSKGIEPASTAGPTQRLSRPHPGGQRRAARSREAGRGTPRRATGGEKTRRPDEWFDLLDRAKADREKRVGDGDSELVDRAQILLPDRQSAELAAAARRANPAAVNELPLEFIDDTLGFHPEWVVDRIAPRPILFITTDGDRLVPPEESEALFARAGEPKKLVTLRGFGHYEVYSEPAFDLVMAETTAWFGKYLAQA